MLSDPQPLQIWNRHAQHVELEYMREHKITYMTHPERSPWHWLLTHPWVDRLVAKYQNSRMSRGHIQTFIRQHHIDMTEFEPHDYRSYSDFFLRKFRAGLRPFVEEPTHLAAFVEGRYFGWERFSDHQRMPVKSKSLSRTQVLGSREYARRFANGPVLMARLSPMDYHYVHYPDAGRTETGYRLGYHNNTVNWRAIQNKPQIICQNERQVSLLLTDHFGCLGFVEVGATTVGKIVQTHPEDQRYSRGQQKGFFRFGGSLVVVFGEEGAWKPAEDILSHTERNVETLVRLGEPVAEVVTH